MLRALLPRISVGKSATVIHPLAFVVICPEPHPEEHHGLPY